MIPQEIHKEIGRESSKAFKAHLLISASVLALSCAAQGSVQESLVLMCDVLFGYSFCRGAEGLLNIWRAARDARCRRKKFSALVPRPYSKQWAMLTRIVQEYEDVLSVKEPLKARVDESEKNICHYNAVKKEIVLSQGLMKKLEENQIRAAVAHEVGHAYVEQKRGAERKRFVGGFVPAVASAVSICGALRLAAYGGGAMGSFSVALPVLFLSPLVSFFWWNRKREKEADSYEVLLSKDPEASISVLEKMREDSRPKGKISRALEEFMESKILLLSTHPPLSERARHMRQLARKWRLVPEIKG